MSHPQSPASHRADRKSISSSLCCSIDLRREEQDDKEGHMGSKAKHQKEPSSESESDTLSTFSVPRAFPETIWFTLVTNIYKSSYYLNLQRRGTHSSEKVTTCTQSQRYEGAELELEARPPNSKASGSLHQLTLLPGANQATFLRLPVLTYTVGIKPFLRTPRQR